MRRRHRSQRGQTIPIIALSATVLMGFTALAVDLGVQTHFRRNLQNTGDSASLAGAHHLGAPPVQQSDRIAGAVDALEVLHNQLQWSLGAQSPSGYATSAVSSAPQCQPSGSSCTVTLNPDKYQITIATPPTTSQVTSLNGDSQYFEVTVREVSANGLGAFVGSSNGTTGAHAIAYHFAPAQPFNFALYAQSYAVQSNHESVIVGNVYAGRSIQPQSNGQTGFCVQGGGIVLGAPQYPNALPNPDPFAGQPQQAQTHPLASPIVTATSCAALGNGQVGQTNVEGCPTNVSIQNVQLSGNTYVDDPSYANGTIPGNQAIDASRFTKACVVYPAIGPPDYQPPTIPSSPPTYGCDYHTTALSGTPPHYQPGKYTCGLTVDAPLSPGIYEMVGNNSGGGHDVIDVSTVLNNCPAAEASTYNTCVEGATFVLENDPNSGVAPIMQVGTGAAGPPDSFRVHMSPYTPATLQSPNDGRFLIYAAPGVQAQLNFDKQATDVVMTGTVDMPGGTINIGTNPNVFFDGQVICQVYNSQQGNHPGGEVSFNGAQAANQREILRLTQ